MCKTKQITCSQNLHVHNKCINNTDIVLIPGEEHDKLLPHWILNYLSGTFSWPTTTSSKQFNYNIRCQSVEN
jgi:hypothetical protein